MNKKIVAMITVLLCMDVCHLCQATPVFARKYRTSCVTCHEAFPRRNIVGEAFRLNGYRFTDDEAYVKTEPVEMGDEAYNRLWPKALWSSDIPANFPLAVVSRFALEADLDGDRDASVLFLFPEELELVWIGTLGKIFTFYGDIRFIQKDFEGGDIESWAQLKARLGIHDFVGPENLFNLYVGSVGMQTLGLYPALQENNLTTHYYQYTSWVLPGVSLQQSGLAYFRGNPFSLQPQVGFELYGFGPRWKYAVGLVSGDVINPADVAPDSDIIFEGAGRNRGGKDGYLQLSFKLGGLGFDGSGAKVDDPLLASPQYWRDNSLIVSLLGYIGSAEIQTETTGGTVSNVDDDFYRVGVGAQQKYQDLTFAAGYMFGRNDQPYGSLSPEPVNSHNVYAEASYYVFPWLIPYVRYEGLFMDLPENVAGLNPNQDSQRWTLGGKCMIRANISTNLEATIYSQGGDLRSNFDKTLFWLLSAAF